MEESPAGAMRRTHVVPPGCVVRSRTRVDGRTLRVQVEVVGDGFEGRPAPLVVSAPVDDELASSPAPPLLSVGSRAGLVRMPSSLGWETSEGMSENTERIPQSDIQRAHSDIAEAKLEQALRGGTRGASRLFSQIGLHPYRWGVSKSQLQEFAELVIEAKALGKIVNSTPEGWAKYPQHKFEDSRIGPTIHQVNEGLIKPYTEEERDFLPGASWALHKSAWA